MKRRRQATWSLVFSAATMGCTTNGLPARLGLPPSAVLPAWAPALAGPLPATTARMLRLDRTQRDRNPLGARLSAALRLEVARELRCDPMIAAADADLRCAPGPAPGAASQDAVALGFARRLTREGHAITDVEFSALLAAFGPDQTTAVVHTIAYANFLGRIVAGLGVVGPMPVVPEAGDDDAATDPRSVPARRSWAAVEAASVVVPEPMLDWSDLDHARLCSLRDRQIGRPSRIPLPGDERLVGLTGRAREMATKVAWSRVGYGYQPALTRQWFACLYAFYEESGIDPLFENSMFWVVTRSNDCFY